MDLGDLGSQVAVVRREHLKLLDTISRVEWRETGYVHLWQFLKEEYRFTKAEAKLLEAQVELLCPKVGITGQSIPERLPATRAGMASGVVSSTHAVKIAATVDQVPVAHVDQVETEMARLAHEFGPTELGRLGTRMVNTLDPDGPEPADPTVVEAQNVLDIRQHRDGSMSGRFELGAESAAVLRPLLSSLTAPQLGDDRTLIERQGDALAEVIVFAANSGRAPIEGGERPHMAITVPLETLQAGFGPAFLDDGHPVTSEQARRWACDAGVFPIVLGSKSEPIDIGQSKRLADKRLRRALAVRDKGCAAPGCGRTPNQCHAHHVKHWVDGGKTTLDNMVLACHYHHRLIHHAGWTVRMDNGLPVIGKPDRMVIAA